MFEIPEPTLAARATACPHWRWMDGMQVLRPNAPAYRVNPRHLEIDNLFVEDRALPDLEDPATLGCLEALVRQAWDNSMLFVRAEYRSPHAHAPAQRTWVVYRPFVGTMRKVRIVEWAQTKAEALVIALEAAP